jgi:hypothetical protein
MYQYEKSLCVAGDLSTTLAPTAPVQHVVGKIYFNWQRWKSPSFLQLEDFCSSVRVGLLSFFIVAKWPLKVTSCAIFALRISTKTTGDPSF